MLASDRAVVTATPLDAELTRLSGALDATRVFYGDTEVRAEQMKRSKTTRKILAMAPASASAERSVSNATKAGADAVTSLLVDVVE